MTTFEDEDHHIYDRSTLAPDQLLQKASEGDAYAHHRLGFLYLKGRDGWPQNEELAFQYFSKGSALGSLSSTYMMGWCYFQGKGVHKDAYLAAKIMKQAADAGHRTSIRSLAFCYEGGLGVPKSPTQAAQLYTKAVELGDVKALNDLAWCYSRGVGVEVDESKSLELFERAVAAGNRHAMFNLGVRYLSGQTGLGKDEGHAVTLFQRGADLGDPSSMCTLGGLYLRGIGIPVDVEKGIGLYKQAAALGHAKSLHKLARCYSKGLGLPKDEARAMQLYEKAAQLGHTKSVFRLARYYVKGTPAIPRDEQRAVQLYQEASDRGHAAATYNLGMRYKEGRGVERNDQLCFMLFKQAAEMNFPPAQYRLATCYLRGIGIAPDEGMALFYFSKAAASTDDRVTSSAAKELNAIRCHVPLGSTTLHEVARLGDMERLPELLASNQDIDFPRALDLKSPLMLALENRRLHLADYLFARGASVFSVDIFSLCASFGLDPDVALLSFAEPAAPSFSQQHKATFSFEDLWQVINQGISLRNQCRRVILKAHLNTDDLPVDLRQYVGPPCPIFSPKEEEVAVGPSSSSSSSPSPSASPSSQSRHIEKQAPSSSPSKSKKGIFSFVFRPRLRFSKSSSKDIHRIPPNIHMRDSFEQPELPMPAEDPSLASSSSNITSLAIEIDDMFPSTSTPMTSRSSDSADSEELHQPQGEDLEISNGSLAIPDPRHRPLPSSSSSSSPSSSSKKTRKSCKKNE